VNKIISLIVLLALIVGAGWLATRGA